MFFLWVLFVSICAFYIKYYLKKNMPDLLRTSWTLEDLRARDLRFYSRAKYLVYACLISSCFMLLKSFGVFNR